jgi:hypothetical protein
VAASACFPSPQHWRPYLRSGNPGVLRHGTFDWCTEPQTNI